jgi:putative DNA primase/helicase
MAQRFLKLLGAKNCTFQTFDDDQERKDKNLTRVLHGTFAEHRDILADLNQRGAGVFVSVNETNLQGRKRENIKRVRALALDLDGAPLEPVQKCRLKPQIVVETSPGRFHAFWRARKFPQHDFEDVQRGLAKRFDGDPAVAILTHVARLPGFYHCKAAPFKTAIVSVSDVDPYAADELVHEFPPLKVPHKPPGSIAGALMLSPDNPRKTAIEFVTRECMVEGAKPPAYCLHHHRGNWYTWSGSDFTEVEEADVIRRLYNFLDDCFTIRKQAVVPFTPTPHAVNQILHGLKYGVLLPRENNPPFWIDGEQRVGGDDLIACSNGLVNVTTGELSPHTPYYFNVNSVPFDYDPDAPAPMLWRKFLRQLWPDDKASRRTLQEIFGLLLTADTSFQKIFMLVGPRRSGKDTIARVATALLGKENVVNPTLASLGGDFGLMPFIGKRAAIISDARLGSRGDSSAVAERLLSISGEDAHSVNRKYKDFWTGHLTTRFLILTNELPRIADASGALASRFVLLTMTNSFYGREDRKLTTRLMPELPGIFNWALEGLTRLRERGYFETPQSSNEAVRALEDLASPIGAFIRDWCDVGPGRIKVKLAYEAWKAWSDQHGHQAGSSATFGRNLHAAFPNVRTRGAGAERFYDGLTLSEAGRTAFNRAKTEAPHRYS